MGETHNLIIDQLWLTHTNNVTARATTYYAARTSPFFQIVVASQAMVDGTTLFGKL